MEHMNVRMRSIVLVSHTGCARLAPNTNLGFCWKPITGCSLGKHDGIYMTIEAGADVHRANGLAIPRLVLVAGIVLNLIGRDCLVNIWHDLVEFRNLKLTKS